MCDTSKVSVGLQGAVNGLLGIAGLGGFWNPVQKDALTDAQDKLKETQSQWTQTLQKEGNKINTDCFSMLKTMIRAGDRNAQAIEAFMENQIRKNTLLIWMLVALVAILTVFDLVSPSK